MAESEVARLVTLRLAANPDDAPAAPSAAGTDEEDGEMSVEEANRFMV